MSSDNFSHGDWGVAGESTEKRHGTLRYGNPPGDPSKAPGCGAKTRRGSLCLCPAMWSTRTGRFTRCRLHGGASTGPKTTGGLARSRRANWKHGEYTADARMRRALLSRIRREIKRRESKSPLAADFDFQIVEDSIGKALCELIEATEIKQREFDDRRKRRSRNHLPDPPRTVVPPEAPELPTGPSQSGGLEVEEAFLDAEMRCIREVIAWLEDRDRRRARRP